jgi:hypothetical protein
MLVHDAMSKASTNYFVMAASRGSAYRPPRISPCVMKRALRLTGEAACFTTGAQEFLGGRYALPRDAAMTKDFD